MCSKIIHSLFMSFGFVLGVLIEALPTVVAFIIAYVFLKWLEMF